MKTGSGIEILESLREQHGVISACVNHARGVGAETMRRRTYSVEQQVLTAMVESNYADGVFEFIYFAAGVNQPHGGMVMMSKAMRGIGVVPVPEEVDENVLDVPF